MTLADIEAAAATLPPEQKQELLRFLTAQLRSYDATRLDESGLVKSKRGFPISRGRSPFNSSDVARIEAEADTLG
ncbi:MAG TPA: hypothetical protein VEP30_04790 [Chthoniobacterales bacterium]|nr:hypothetical protein [Chthoniobacterales bacterium]